MLDVVTMIAWIQTHNLENILCDTRNNIWSVCSLVYFSIVFKIANQPVYSNETKKQKQKQKELSTLQRTRMVTRGGWPTLRELISHICAICPIYFSYILRLPDLIMTLGSLQLIGKNCMYGKKITTD